MPTTGPESRLYVVVGVIRNPKGQLLIQQRQLGKPCAGQWEFPGGKLEDNETPEKALIRELDEELGAEVVDMKPLTQIAHDYDHASVWLDVYLIENFDGNIIGHEGQTYNWKDVNEIRRMDILDAVNPILDTIIDLD